MFEASRKILTMLRANMAKIGYFEVLKSCQGGFLLLTDPNVGLLLLTDLIVVVLLANNTSTLLVA